MSRESSPKRKLSVIVKDRRTKVAKLEHSPRKSSLRNGHSSKTSHWQGMSTGSVPWEIYCGDAVSVLSGFTAGRFACVVTSPPYFWQRDYEVDGQIGKESTIDEYVDAVATCMDQVNRVLADNGCLFLNLGDTYYSAKGKPHGNDPKNKARRMGLRAVDSSGLGVPRKTTIGIPWRVALEMIARGWVLRSPIIWARKGAIPEPTAKDRPWRTYETIFMFTKKPKYFFNRAELGSDEDIWYISDRPKASSGLHYAAFPDTLVEKCLRIGCAEKGEVLDPFAGTGTVLRVAARLGHSSVGIDLNQKFCVHAASILKKAK